MNFSNTSSFQAGFIQSVPQRGPKNFREVGLKTSNPDIFPSLNPLSGMYRPSKSNKVNASFAGHMESHGPVKKIKVEQGRQAVVLNTNTNEYARTSIQQVKSEDQDVFRVPKLPKRLLDKKSKETHESKQNDFTERLQGFQSVGEFFLDNEPSNQNLQSMSVQINSYPQVQIPFSPRVQGVSNTINQEADSLLLNSFYERLKLEYYNFQLRQSLLCMYQLGQSQLLQNMQRMPQGVRAVF